MLLCLRTMRCCDCRFGGDRPFNYFTFGAAVAEVELDCLTGDFQVQCRNEMSNCWAHMAC